MDVLRKMMFLFVGLSIFSGCQKTFYVTEIKNNFGTVFGSGREHVISEVIQISDEHYIICGTVNGGSNGMFDGFVMQVDESFNVVWYRNYGGSKEDYFKSMAIDEQGNILLAGNTNSFGVSLDSARTDLNPLFYLVLINKSGDKIWEKTHQGNETKKNYSNDAEKVLYLGNSTFCISGETGNYQSSYNGSNYYSIDYYAFCYNEQGHLLWNNRYYNLPVSFMMQNEYCQEASLCDDGNIMLQFKSIDTSKTFCSVNLAKIAVTGNGFSINKFIRKSKPINDLFDPSVKINSRLAMASIGGNRVVLADLIHKGIALTNDSGEIVKRIAFKNPIEHLNLYSENNKIFITGSYETSMGAFPCWAIADYSGKIEAENFLIFDKKISKKLHFHKIFFTKKMEVVVFGSLETNNGSILVMLRYDQKGNLIKER